MRSKECPKCGEEMTFVGDDPDCGINAGWDCECGHTEAADYSDYDDE